VYLASSSNAACTSRSIKTTLVMIVIVGCFKCWSTKVAGSRIPGGRMVSCGSRPGKLVRNLEIPLPFHFCTFAKIFWFTTLSSANNTSKHRFDATSFT
jgi:hypothetical protein